MAQNNNIFDLILNANCEIGNHGYNHKDHTKISKQQNLDEISNTHTLVKNLADIDMNLFAPPSGSYNKQTLEIANSLGYKTIMWSKDTIDWRDKNANLIYTRATTNLANGDLIGQCTEKVLSKSGEAAVSATAGGVTGEVVGTVVGLAVPGLAEGFIETS